MSSVPVASLLAGQTRLDYIEQIMDDRPELQDDPRYVPTSAYWDENLEIEHQARLTTYGPDSSDSSSDSDEWPETDWPPTDMQPAIKRSFEPLESKFSEC